MAWFPRLKRLGRDRRGATLVEFTLVAPLLISLMCGLAEFGMALQRYHVLQKGVRDAGRFLSRVREDCTPSAYQAALAAWPNPRAVPVQVTAVDCDVGAAEGLGVVTVSASEVYEGLGMLGFIGVEPPTLAVAHQQLVIGS